MKISIVIYVITLLGLGISLYQEPTLKESMERGNELYKGFCVTCHLDNGKGVPPTFPPLANSDYLMQKREESIHALKYGLQGVITVNGTTYNNAMVAMGLEDEEIADIMNYIMNSWGNEQDTMVTVEEVAAVAK